MINRVKNINISKLTEYSFYSLFVFPVLPPAVQSIVFLSFFLLHLNSIFTNKEFSKEKIYDFLVFSSFYIFSLLSFFWSQNKLQFFKEIAPNFSLLFVIFIFSFSNSIKKYNKSIVLKVSMVSISIFFIYWVNYILKGIEIFNIHNVKDSIYPSLSYFDKIIYVIKEWYKGNNLYQLGLDGYYYFVTNHESYLFIHHTYIGLVCNILLVLLLSSNNFFNPTLYFFSLILSVIIFFGGSQVNQFLFFINVFIITLFKFRKRLKLIMFFVILIISSLTIIKKELIYTYYYKLIKVEGQEFDDGIGIDGKRLEIFKTTFSLIKNNWMFGVGVGDEKDELYSINQSSVIKNMNTHSQFLYYFLIGGVVNFLLYLLFFFKLFSINKSFYSFLIISNFFINSLIENIMNRNYGVFILFILLSILLLRDNLKKTYE
jgi:O-antigen ligase